MLIRHLVVFVGEVSINLYKFTPSKMYDPQLLAKQQQQEQQQEQEQEQEQEQATLMASLLYPPLGVKASKSLRREVGDSFCGES